MTVFVVMVEKDGRYDKVAKVSQEGYRTLEAAQDFIRSRVTDDIEEQEIYEFNPYVFVIGRITYTIVEVSIQ